MDIFIKICGITNLEDAKIAISSGANAIGLMRYADSPRYIEEKRLDQIYEILPKSVKAVPVFANESAEEVERVLNMMPDAIPQFHGDEDSAYCESFGVEYLKAIKMDESINLKKEAESYTSSLALLLDSKDINLLGGTGFTFDWNLVDLSLEKNLILAGGLSPENIERALSSGQYWGVDVSSGVESSLGKKDKNKIVSFIRTIRDRNE